MSQSYSYEVANLITASEPICADFPNPVSPSNKPLQTCYAEGINKASDTDTPGIQSSSSVFPYNFVRRRSTLGRDDREYEKLALRISLEEPVFDDSSPMTLAESEGEQNIKTEASRKQNDEVRMTVHSDRRTREQAITHAWECNHANQPDKKSAVRDGS